MDFSINYATQYQQCSETYSEYIIIHRCYCCFSILSNFRFFFLFTFSWFFIEVNTICVFIDLSTINNIICHDPDKKKVILFWFSVVSKYVWIKFFMINKNSQHLYLNYSHFILSFNKINKILNIICSRYRLANQFYFLSFLTILSDHVIYALNFYIFFLYFNCQKSTKNYYFF